MGSLHAFESRNIHYGMPGVVLKRPSSSSDPTILHVKFGSHTVEVLPTQISPTEPVLRGGFKVDQPVFSLERFKSESQKGKIIDFGMKGIVKRPSSSDPEIL